MEPAYYRRAAREYFAGRVRADAFAGGTDRARLRARVLPTPSADNRSRDPDDGEGAPVAEVLRSAVPRAALIARPGGGKTTTLLQHALALAADDDGPLPVYVQLRDLDGGYTDLERLIVESMQQVVPEATRQDLDDGAWALLLDGVNERVEKGDPFARLIANFPHTHMVFTTREPSAHFGQQIELLPLAAADRDSLVAAWIPAQAVALQQRLAGDARLGELSRTPLLLALLCDATRGGLEPASTRAALIRASLERHAVRYAEKVRTDARAPGRVDGWLAALAHGMLRRGTLRIDLADAADIVRAAPRAPVDPEDSLRHLTKFHLLALSGLDVVEFVHPLIQEFYAAQHLRGVGSLPDRRTLIREYVNSTLWTEPLRLFAEECGDPTIATHLVDATCDVDAILAARLVGSFPAQLQPALLARLCADDDTPGTRLTRAFAVGTEAALDELERLAAHPVPEVRFQVADGLWGLAFPRAAAINHRLLADSSLLVVNAAAHNLRRHPAPDTVLLAALAREDLWTASQPYALPFLVRALLASDTPAAAARGCELARVHLARADDSDGIFSPRSSVREAVRHELFAARPGPCLTRALVELLGECGEPLTWQLLQVLQDSVEIVDLDPALAHLPAAKQRQIIAWALQCPGRFHMSDERLLAVLRRSFLDPDGDRLFAEAAARRCRGLVEWLAQLVAGEVTDDEHEHGEHALMPLFALDAAIAVNAASRALTASCAELRGRMAVTLCARHEPEFAELRRRAVEVVRADPRLAANVVQFGDVQLSTEILEAVLDWPNEAAGHLAGLFLEHWHIVRFLHALRDRADRDPIAWPSDMPQTVRRMVARCLLQFGDPALAEKFLRSRLGRETRDVVVMHLEHVVEIGERAAVTKALAHLNELDWTPTLVTYARMLTEGRSGYAMRRPNVDPDAIFVAMRPLLRHDDATTRQWALAAISPPPPGHLAEFLALIDEPEFAMPVAHRIVNTHLHAAFPELLRRPGLVVADPEVTDATITVSDDAPSRYDLRPIEWHTFKWALDGAPHAVLAACVEILATREEPEWRQLFLALFARAPAFRHHARVLAALRDRDADDFATEALIRCATRDELAVLDRWHDDPGLPALTVARMFAEVASAEAVPLVLARLIRLVEDPDMTQTTFIHHNRAAWWMRHLASAGGPRDGARIAALARRTADVWLAQELYRTAAEIQQRTGIYNPRHTTMPPSWTLLHLSDLHFSAEDQPERWHSALAEDLRRELRVERLDALVLSGDIVDRGSVTGYAAAERFIVAVCDEFRVPRDRVVLVPGNHDIDRGASAPAIRSVRTRPHDFTVGDRRYAIADRAAYARRLAGFADFFVRTLGQPYPLDPRDQARLWVWDDLGVVVLGLSSVGEIDGLRPGNATIDDTALSRALASLRGVHDDSLKIAVFHHPLDSPAEDRLRDAKFLERLAVAGFSLVLHGHVHQADNRLFRYDRTAKGRRIEVVGAGTFGARSVELPTACPWQYNLLRFTGDRVRVETRHRVADNAPWKAHACWSTGAGEEPRSWYELKLGPGR